MRPIPSFLPGADSRKWRNRQSWDPLGQARVAVLADPSWARDAAWLLRLLMSHRPAQPGPGRDLIDIAIREARAAQNLRHRPEEPTEAYAARVDHQWDRVLDALDAYLESVEADHTRLVEAERLRDEATGGGSG